MKVHIDLHVTAPTMGPSWTRGRECGAENFGFIENKHVPLAQ
jgi:hypothetical protein